MTFQERINAAADKNNSLVCIGLDSEISKLPAHLKELPDGQFEFNKAIVDATGDLVCAYKPNSAFYEANGAEGIMQLKKTCDYIRMNYPKIPIILDAKRGDIGNTNDAYAKYCFDYLGAHAVTVQPYLGIGALSSFLQHADKGIIILVRTSNPEAAEFQDLQANGKPLYLTVAEMIVSKWNKNKNCAIVAGATQPDELRQLRSIVGDMPILIPGVGAQGGDVELTVKNGIDASKKNAIINSSRAIIFASSGEDFAQRAREEAQKLRDLINSYRS